jgi:20S proteasome alpha/beta subunit
MSCIAGLAVDNGVFMAADSMATAGTLSVEEYSPKIDYIIDEFKEPYLVGCVESIRLNQIVKAHLVIEDFDPDPLTHIVKNFVEPLRYCLREFGFSAVDGGREVGGFFLIGYKNKLFSIQGDYQVSEARLGYDAIGCGAPIAIGSLYTSDILRADIGVKRRIELALGATIKYDAYCGGDIVTGVLDEYVRDCRRVRIYRGYDKLVEYIAGDDD